MLVKEVADRLGGELVERLEMSVVVRESGEHDLVRVERVLRLVRPAQAAEEPPHFIAGFPIPGPEVLELARLVGPTDPKLADRLESAYGRQVRVFALDVPERENLLWALDDPPTKALSELRGVLLQEHEGRVRDGLV